MSSHQGRPAGEAAAASLPSSTPSFLSLFALQDLMMIAYLLIVWRLVWSAGPGPEAEWCARRVYVCIGVMVFGCWASRVSKALPHAARWVIYRVAIAGVLLENYLMLRELLPLVRPDSVDAALLNIDLRLFGVEPAIWLERFNVPPIIEYFSFFYFSYFFICGTYLLTVVFLSKAGTQTAHFAIGTLIVFCFGQIGYMAVPAFGPIHYLKDQFHGPINGGFFWSCVWNTVQAGSAMKDVFPSLHTAVPTWFTLFAWTRSRQDPRWRIPALVTGFFAFNIIISTMLLRWHYAIDIVAGITLASSAGFFSPRLARWEESLRRRLGLAKPWVLDQ